MGQKAEGLLLSHNPNRRLYRCSLCAGIRDSTCRVPWRARDRVRSWVRAKLDPQPLYQGLQLLLQRSFDGFQWEFDQGLLVEILGGNADGAGKVTGEKLLL